MKKYKRMLLGALLLLLLLFTACSSKAEKAMAKAELGQKYLTELNYTEAVASFTEAIGLDPDSITGYMGRAQAYAGLEQYEEAKADYTKALDSLKKLPDDTDVLDVKATKVEAYTGRAAANNALEKYEDVLSDDDALIELGEDKTAERDTLLAAISLAKSKAGDLNSAIDWLEEVNHADYAEDIQLTTVQSLLQRAAELTKMDGINAKDKVQELLISDTAQVAIRNVLALGYQLRYYDTDGKMLAVYTNYAASWVDVNEKENGSVTEATLAAEPVIEKVMPSWYAYYGTYAGRSREGEGIWFRINLEGVELTDFICTWKDDQMQAPDRNVVFQGINEARVRNGQDALTESAEATAVAEKWVELWKQCYEEQQISEAQFKAQVQQLDAVKVTGYGATYDDWTDWVEIWGKSYDSVVYSPASSIGMGFICHDGEPSIVIAIR